MARTIANINNIDNNDNDNDEKDEKNENKKSKYGRKKTAFEFHMASTIDKIHNTRSFIDNEMPPSPSASQRRESMSRTSHTPLNLDNLPFNTVMYDTDNNIIIIIIILIQVIL